MISTQNGIKLFVVSSIFLSEIATASVNISQRFFNAVKYNKSIEEVAKYLNQGAFVDYYEELPSTEESKTLKCTALMYAVTNNNLPVVKLLCQKKANLEIDNNFGDTAVMYAVNYNRPEILQFLIQQGAQINIENKSALTPLMLATVQGFCKIIDILVEHNAAINFVNRRSETALTIAILVGNVDSVRCLLAHRSKVNVNLINHRLESPIFIALSPRLHKKFSLEKNKEIIKMLIEAGALLNISNSRGETPLFLAIQNGYDMSIIQELTRNVDGRTPADVRFINVHNQNALFYLTRYTQPDVLEYCINHLDDMINHQNNGNQTPLFIAAFKGYYDIVKFLYDHGASVNILDIRQVTPLSATIMGSYENLNPQKKMYHMSREDIEEEYKKLITFFVTHGVDINQVDFLGYTALFYACHSFSRSVFDHLLKLKPNISIVSREGTTALFQVAESGDLEMAQALVEAGADINIKDNNNYTALSYAVRNKNMSVINYFLEQNIEYTPIDEDVLVDALSEWKFSNLENINFHKLQANMALNVKKLESFSVAKDIEELEKVEQDIQELNILEKNDSVATHSAKAKERLELPATLRAKVKESAQNEDENVSHENISLEQANPDVEKMIKSEKAWKQNFLLAVKLYSQNKSNDLASFIFNDFKSQVYDHTLSVLDILRSPKMIEPLLHDLANTEERKVFAQQLIDIKKSAKSIAKKQLFFVEENLEALLREALEQGEQRVREEITEISSAPTVKRIKIPHAPKARKPIDLRSQEVRLARQKKLM